MRTMRVSTPCDAVVGHRHGLGEALGLVVDAARPDRVDVAPVVLALRVHERIAVDLRGRGEQEAGALGLGQAERVVGAERADLQRLDRQLEVVDAARPGWRSAAPSRRGRRAWMYSVTLRWTKVKPRVGREAAMLSGGAGDEVVHADDLAAPGQERLAQVGADEAGAAGDQDAHQALRSIAAVGSGLDGRRACARSSGTRSRAGASAPAPRCCGRRRSPAAASRRAAARGRGT